MGKKTGRDRGSPLAIQRDANKNPGTKRWASAKKGENGEKHPVFIYDFSRGRGEKKMEKNPGSWSKSTRARTQGSGIR